MKILGLCFLLFFCLASVLQAQIWPNQDTPSLQKNDQVAQNSLSPEYVPLFRNSRVNSAPSPSQG